MIPCLRVNHQGITDKDSGGVTGICFKSIFDSQTPITPQRREFHPIVFPKEAKTPFPYRVHPRISPYLPLSPLIAMRQNLIRESRNQVDTNYTKMGKRRFAPHRVAPAPSHRRATPLSVGNNSGMKMPSKEQGRLASRPYGRAKSCEGAISPPSSGANNLRQLLDGLDYKLQG